MMTPLDRLRLQRGAKYLNTLGLRAPSWLLAVLAA